MPTAQIRLLVYNVSRAFTWIMTVNARNVPSTVPPVRTITHARSAPMVVIRIMKPSNASLVLIIFGVLIVALLFVDIASNARVNTTCGTGLVATAADIVNPASILKPPFIIELVTNAWKVTPCMKMDNVSTVRSLVKSAGMIMSVIPASPGIT